MLALYRFITSLVFLTTVAVCLLAVRMIFSDSLRYGFMFWNLFLALVPVFLAWWLTERVQKYGWLQWPQIILSLVWLLFLPNSFYMITDLIHLRPNFEADLLFDITILISFVMAGIIFGFISLFLVQRELVKRMPGRYAYTVVAGVILASSFAICLGRYTRWNTWDILLQPAGLLFDVSDRLLNPATHWQTYQTTIILFFFLFASYTVVWEGGRLIRAIKP